LTARVTGEQAGAVMARWFGLGLFTWALTACAGGETKPQSADAAESPANEPMGDETPEPTPTGDDDDDAEAVGLPTECASTTDDGICLPPKGFVKRLCKDDYPSVALALFSADMPFKHAYVAVPTEAWSAGGGATPEKMPVDEEVLILAYRAKPKPGGGMKVSGTQASYEALRWNGTCVTLGASELRWDTPPNPLNARIIFQRLDADIREALKHDENLRPLYLEHRKACKGVSMGAVSKDCERLDGEFSQALAAHVRERGGVPNPEKLPE